MVVVNPGPGPLDYRILSLFHAKDPLLGSILAFYGPSTTTNSTQNSSRIQGHIFSIAGFQSFPRLTIAPSSPLYKATVPQLSPDEQGDEICRGLAICLLKYFSDMPNTVKQCFLDLVTLKGVPSMFDGRHAAELASKMNRLDDPFTVGTHLQHGLAQRCLSWTDVDVILPEGVLKKVEASDPYAQDDAPSIDYGPFAEIVDLFGTPSFLPTSRLKRAPSKPTAGSKSRILAEGQKLSLQREMREFLETENSYKLKVSNLANSVAAEYYRNEVRSSSGRIAANEKAMQKLFPPSLLRILDINTEFLDRMRDFMGDGAADSSMQEQQDTTPWMTERDQTGAEAFARLLLQFFPRFKEPYQEYLQASSHFSKTLNEMLRNSASGAARAIRQTGEQRLRSWLIEPVQRLPRYSLYIENIVNQLPADHAAMPKFLRAKDIIADICALEQDEPSDNKPTIKIMKTLIAYWPEGLAPEGRLITAVDAVEVKAPYNGEAAANHEAQSLLLLFSDYVLVVRKIAANALSARGLLAEVDRPPSSVNTVQATPQGSQQRLLNLAYSFQLHDTWFTESNDGRLIHLACVSKASEDRLRGPDRSPPYLTTTRAYTLLGPYDGKASRWSEEIAKARIEFRFPERMRENGKWDIRVLSPQQERLGIVSAIFENDLDAPMPMSRLLPGRVKIVIEQEAQTESTSASKNGEPEAEISGRVVILPSGKYRLELNSSGEVVSLDNIAASDFISVFVKQLSSLQRINQQPNIPRMAHIFISNNQKIAYTIQSRLPAEKPQPRNRFKAPSPVKSITSLLGVASREQNSYSKLPSLGTEMVAQKLGDSAPSTKTLRSIQAQSTPKLEPGKNEMNGIRLAPTSVDNTFTPLENTLSTYVVALHSRCGNVVGKVIRNRANADELAVNELYNALLEDPNQFQATAEVPVDVLFAAFEKFLNHEWRDRLGSVLQTSALDKMQALFNTTPSSQLQEPFRDLLNEMSPQNRRAFAALAKLLYELLEASGNDGDRGALTAAFAEVMIEESDPYSYISLLDRLVENIGTLFDDIDSVDAHPASKDSSLQGTRSTNTGSLSSTASSLKKRFGFGYLTRENSKTESESRVGQMIRNLSKKASAEGSSQPSSLSKSFLSRSRSTDNENRRPLGGFLSRPVSKDGSQALSNLGSPPVRPGTSHQISPTPAGANQTARATAQDSPRKAKRRSSLSDLTNLRNSPMPDFASPNRPRKADMPPDVVSPLQTARRVLRTPSPSKMQRLPEHSVTKIPSPTNLKENLSPSASSQSPSRETFVKPAAEVRLGSGFSPKKKDLASTTIPSLKYGTPKTTTVVPSRKTSSPQKLRVQSPQKLRERLDREKKAIEEAGRSFQSDFSKMADEMAASKPSRHGSTVQSKDLASRVGELETKMTGLLNELHKRTSSIQSDIDSSLAVSEKKAKSLDELYREANSENELLYERFNTELGRLLKSVKDGKGNAEMIAKLKESQDEAARMRKENQRLKRENLGLRSQLKGP